jgi:hypothetical protein
VREIVRLVDLEEDGGLTEVERNPKLAMLDPLVGRWTVRTSMGDGWTRLEWHQSGWFLEQYSDGDGRGVLRIYRMSVADGVWRMWRDAPGFNQRFSGRISDDGQTIEAAWEFSRDGTGWQKDFDVTYRRQS